MKYSIDTSSLILAWEEYPETVFRQLWKKLAKLIVDGDLRASAEVETEVDRLADGLTSWVSENDDLIVALDQAQQRNVKKILASHPNLVDLDKERSLADPFVIALAMSKKGCAVVTEEDGSVGKRIKIPHVCQHYKIPCMRFVELIGREKWRF